MHVCVCVCVCVRVCSRHLTFMPNVYCTACTVCAGLCEGDADTEPEGVCGKD